MGEGQRPEAVAAADEEPHPEITLREISAWSLAILATVAVGFLLYAAREVMLPVVAAFVVGIMLGPAARRLEALHVPRPLVALLLVASVTLIFAFVILLIFPRVSELANGLPGIVASLKEKLHVFDGLGRSVAAPHNDDRRPAQHRWGCASFARDFMGSLDDLDTAAADHGLSVLSRRAAFGHLGMARLAARPRHDLRKPRFASDGAQNPQRN